METIKCVGVKALKDQLSSYLREVKSGANVLITERGNVIAELHRPTRAVPLSQSETILSRWVTEGRLKRPLSKKRKCPASPISSSEGTSTALLNQDRDE